MQKDLAERLPKIDVTIMSAEEQQEHITKINSFIEKTTKEYTDKLKKALDMYGLQAHILFDLKPEGVPPEWTQKKTSKKRASKKKVATKKASKKKLDK